MRIPTARTRGIALAVFALAAAPLWAQFADQSVINGLNAFLPQSVLNNPQIVLFYWSNNWNVVSRYTEAQINAAVNLMVMGNGIDPPYFTRLGQYTDTAGDRIVPTLQPAFGDTSQLVNLTACGIFDPSPTINSVDLTTWVQCMLDGTGSIGFGFPPTIGKPDTLPMIFLPTPAALNNDQISVSLNTLVALDTAVGTGLLVKLFPTAISIPNGCSDFYGYHLWTSPLVSVLNPFANPKLRIAYGVIPLSCFSVVSPLASDVSGFYTSFDDLTGGISHEMVEALTDPFVPLGWIDNSTSSPLKQGEAADICYQGARNSNVWYQNAILSAYWSNIDGTCVVGNSPGLSNITLAVAFRNDGPATVMPKVVTFQLDSRSGKLISGGGPNGNNDTFTIQVANQTSHSYQFPATLVQNPTYQVVPVDNNQPLKGTDFVNGNITHTVNYKTQYQLTVLGPNQANPAPPSGYYDIGNVPVTTDPTYMDAATNKLWQFFNWTGTSTIWTNNFTANVNQSLFYQAQYVRDISSEISFVRSGLTYNRATQTYYGTITITNNGTEILSNLLIVALKGLPAGVTLSNAAGTYLGAPYLNTNTSAGLPPGTSTSIPVQFKVTGNPALNYSIGVYSMH